MNLRTYASSSSQLLSSDESGWPEWCSRAVRTASRVRSLGSLGSGKTLRVRRRPVSAGDDDEAAVESCFRVVFRFVGVRGGISLLEDDATVDVGEGGELSRFGGVGAPFEAATANGGASEDRVPNGSFGGRLRETARSVSPKKLRFRGEVRCTGGPGEAQERQSSRSDGTARVFTCREVKVLGMVEQSSVFEHDTAAVQLRRLAPEALLELRRDEVAPGL